MNFTLSRFIDWLGQALSCVLAGISINYGLYFLSRDFKYSGDLNWFALFVFVIGLVLFIALIKRNRDEANQGKHNKLLKRDKIIT